MTGPVDPIVVEADHVAVWPLLSVTVPETVRADTSGYGVEDTLRGRRPGLENPGLAAARGDRNDTGIDGRVGRPVRDVARAVGDGAGHGDGLPVRVGVV